MHIVTGELRKAPYTKDNCGQDGQSKMYILELSEMIKDYQTGDKTYTNYSAMIFAKSQGQKDYYNSSLVEGNWVSLTAEKLKVDKSDCGQYIKLRMENARVENSGYTGNTNSQGGQQHQAAPQQHQQSGGFQQQSTAQQQPVQQGGFQQQQQNNNFQQQQPAQQQGGGFQQQQAAPQQGGFQQQAAPQQQPVEDDIPF